MVWLYGSPIPGGGGNFPVQMISIATRRGGGVGTLCSHGLILCRLGTGMKWAQNACPDNKALMQGGRVGILNASTAFWPSDSNPLISIWVSF
jgi:hypothetical protein